MRRLMRRLRPASMVGQLVGLLLLALGLSQAIGFFIYRDERTDALRGVVADEFISRAASVALLLEATPPALHEQALRAVSTSYTRYWLTPAEPKDVVAWQQQAWRHLADGAPSTHSSPFAMRASQERWDLSAGFLTAVPASAAARSAAWEILPASAWSLARPAKLLHLDHAYALGLAVPLAGGGWLNAAYAKPLSADWSSQAYVSLAIMGGEISGCTPDTTEVFLEVALFDPTRTAASGRKLGIESDARYRFERGLDPQSAMWGAEVAARLILEFCGGEASNVVSAGELPRPDRRLTLRPDRVKSLGGLDLPATESQRILQALGFAVNAKDGVLRCDVPSWRADVEGEADLVEEVLRVHGFDRVPAVPMALETALPEAAITPAQRRVTVAKRALVSRGLMEAVTFSFMDGRIAGRFTAGNRPPVALANPIAADLDVMRPSILPNLLQAAVRNAARGSGDVALFEVGPQYADDTPEGQLLVAAGIRIGSVRPRHWAAHQRAADAFDAKADAQALLAICGAPVDNLQVSTDAPGWYHPGRSGVLRLGPTVLAQFGELHPRVLRELNVRGAAVGFELFLERIPQPKAKGKGAASTRPLLQASAYQPVERDFAFVVAADVPAEKLVRAVKGADKALIQAVSLFDVFEGGSLGAGRKSLAVSVTLQALDRTLTEQEIAAVSEKIVAAVTKATGAELRR